MTITLPSGVKDNLRFLCVEVDSQLTALKEYLTSPTTAIARRILDRSGYSYNLKTRIHSGCVNKLSASKQHNKQLSLRGAEFIATDLERITELTRECVKQMSYVGKPELLHSQWFDPLLEQISGGVNQVMDAIETNDSQVALKIGQRETAVEAHYDRLYKHYIRALKTKKQTQDLTQILFVAQSLKQMGDALLHISESIVSANLGQPVNFERYFSLQSLAQNAPANEDTILIDSVAETRSGSAISGIRTSGADDNEYMAIFKEGIKRKVKEERQGMESWHEIYPGLAPKILSYKKRGQSAALLIEHLPGSTFEQILINEPQATLDEAFNKLNKTLRSVWNETRNSKPVSADFMGQTQKRLAEVYKIHPEFQQAPITLCDLTLPSFDDLVKAAKQIEKQVAPPFSVYIHGDFNVDNIIYDPMDKRIHFIDLHRSRYMDYVQDVSVFMVSNFRLQILDAPLRRRILDVAIRFYTMACRYANKANDDSFEIRMALGLARSFVTSTRFILDKSLAKQMFLRSRYLLELILTEQPKHYSKFKLPIKEILSD